MQPELVKDKRVIAARSRNQTQACLYSKLDYDSLCIHTLAPKLQHGAIAALQVARIGCDGQNSCFTSYEDSVRWCIGKPGYSMQRYYSPMQICCTGIRDLHRLRRAIGDIHF